MLYFAQFRRSHESNSRPGEKECRCFVVRTISSVAEMHTILELLNYINAGVITSASPMSRSSSSAEIEIAKSYMNVRHFAEIMWLPLRLLRHLGFPLFLVFRRSQKTR